VALACNRYFEPRFFFFCLVGRGRGDGVTLSRQKALGAIHYYYYCRCWCLTLSCLVLQLGTVDECFLSGSSVSALPERCLQPMHVKGGRPTGSDCHRTAAETRETCWLVLVG
jgi:hypothetical protein